MLLKQICTLFCIIISAQTILGKPYQNSAGELEHAEQPETSEEQSPKAKKVKSLSTQIVMLIKERLIELPKQYNANVAHASQQLLNDENIKHNLKPEVVEFKTKLNQILANYDPNNNGKKNIHNTLTEFKNLTNNYLLLPQEKQTPDTKLIIELLHKYNFNNLLQDINANFESFFQQFDILFDELRETDKDMPIEVSLFQWLEKLKTLTNWQEKYDSFLDLLKGSDKKN